MYLLLVTGLKSAYALKCKCNECFKHQRSSTLLYKHNPTCGGVGVEVALPPDMISSVMSFPPWLGSRILI